MIELKGKKLLVLGGAFQHCKIVEAAKELGVITYVTDYLPFEQAPAKQIADHYSIHNITDIDAIVEMCKNECIDGVISLCLDACQRPYQQICEKLNVPCFGNKEQFRILTDKNAFKKTCREHGVDVIPEYQLSDFGTKEICEKYVEFPILIKPCDSRGSRGQSTCYTFEEAIKAIEFAKSESSTGEVVIEKYMGNKNDFSMSYILINGEAYLTRTGDRFLGAVQDRMDKLAIAGVSPSRYNEFYVKEINTRVVNMLQNIGLKTAPVFMQGFIDGDTVRFYDPGLRFPGIEYERMYEAVNGINPIKLLIEYALIGKVTFDCRSMISGADLKGKTAVDLLIAIKPGVITEISGLQEVINHPDVISVFTKYSVGDSVGEHYNVNQRFCEIDIVCEDNQKMKETIDWIYNTLIVKDEFGDNMIFSKLDTDCFLQR